MRTCTLGGALLVVTVPWLAGCGGSGAAGTAGAGTEPQSISFEAPASSVTYGAPAAALTASSDSGLPVSYSVTGPASLSAGALVFSGVGTVTVTASQAGNSTYGAATPVSHSIVVTPASLSVTANSFSIIVGKSTPTLTALVTGFVNGDTAASAVTGAPSLSASSPAAEGSYAIIAALGTLAARNYSFTSFANGTLSVLPAATAGSNLVIPPLLLPTIDSSGVKHFAMNMLKGSSSLLAGVSSTTEGFNGVWMAPTVEVNDGDRVAFAFNNALGEDTTVHIHGLHVPAVYDGGAFGVFASGTTYSPSFTVNQPAATLWYHPHVMGDTARGISLGLVGMFIVGDSSASSTLLPNLYGVNDIPLVLQDPAIASDGSIQYTGASMTSGLDFPLLLNGMNVSSNPAILHTGENRLRFRLLNASIGAQFTLSMSDQSAFSMIASDAGYLVAPLAVTSVTLGPGERAEIIVDVAANASRTLLTTVQSMIASVPSAPIATLVVSSSGVGTPAALPATLNTIAPYATANAVTRTVTLTADAAGFGINGVDVLQLSQFAQSAIHTTLGNTEVWNIVEQTGGQHFFHMHDVRFQVRSINGSPPPAVEAGWKDTVAVPPYATVQIVMQFLDYADADRAYMLHCHILTHEDAGMMAAFFVDPGP